jgi:hypothetical protein
MTWMEHTAYPGTDLVDDHFKRARMGNLREKLFPNVRLDPMILIVLRLR